MDEVAERIREKHAKKQEASKQRYEEHKEAVEKGEKKLIVERTPNGLYFLSWEGGGQLAEELKGKHTSIDKVRKMVISRYGKDLLA